MFKKFLAAAAVSAFVLPAFAVPKEGEIMLTGKVPESCELVVQESGMGREIMDLSKGAENLIVGKVSSKCNDMNGYKVTVHFKNGSMDEEMFRGAFVDSVSGDKLPFTLSYGGTKATSPMLLDSEKPTTDFAEHEVAISYAADPNLSSTEGFTYTEGICFMIEDR